MEKELSFLLANISIYIGLIPSAIAFFRIKSPILVHRQLAILVWGITTIGILADIISFVFFWPNLFLLHIYTIFEFILLTLIFKPVLKPLIFKSLLILFPLFAAINSIFFERLNSTNVLNRSIGAFILMFYALSFFTKTLKEMKIIRLEQEPLFWISIGVLFYNAGSFFIFIFSSDLTPQKELFFTYFGIHAILAILMYIFYTIALWVQPKH